MSGKSAFFENGTVFEGGAVCEDGVRGFLAATPTPYDRWLTGRTPKSPRATRTLRTSSGSTSARSMTIRPPACWTTAYPRSSVDSGDSARICARRWSIWSPARCTFDRTRALDRPVAASSSCLRAVIIARGSAMTGLERKDTRRRRSSWMREVRARHTRWRVWWIAARCSMTSGTISLAASVGVEARTSATKSSRGVSTSWPMALTTGVTASATALTRASLLKGSRSSKDPPPRVITMTSTLRSASSSRRAVLTSGTVLGPWTETCRISNWTAGQRFRAFSTTSFSAALARPQISPTLRGRKGMGCLRSRSNNPSDARTRLRCSSLASSSPTPTGRIWRASRFRVPRLVQNVGLAWTTTRAPSDKGTGMASRVVVRMVTLSDMSTSASRNVRYAVACPGRRLTWTTCPSTHRADILSTYSEILMLSRRTGQGFSAVVSEARSGGGWELLTAVTLGGDLTWWGDFDDKACVAGCPTWVLRRRGPGCGDGREGAGALRATGLCAQGDRSQQARGDHVAEAWGDLRRRDPGGARGRDRHLLGPRRRTSRARRGQGTVAEDDRRNLPAGDQGPPGGRAFRGRGVRHPADRSRGS